MMMSEASQLLLYQSAEEALYSSVHQSVTPATIAAAAARRTRTVSDMQVYLSRVGLSSSNSSIPRMIHVTGTKGKGSTACLCESVLRQAYGLSTGLFTSPHLVSIRERIRVNGQPVSKAVFGQAYWDVRQRLEQYSNDDGLPVLPGYFRMLTILALYIFEHYQLSSSTAAAGPPVTGSGTSNRKKQKLDCIIFEVGMGGRYDATNCLTFYNNNNNTETVVPRVVRGITLIDYDHCRVLGNTLPEIAWEKGGICQVEKGASAPLTPHPQRESAAYDDEVALHSSQQEQPQQDSDTLPYNTCFALDTNTPQVLQVLTLCAAIEGQGARLHVVDTTDQQQHPLLPPFLGLPGAHQRLNALLALAMCESLMHPISVPNVTDLQRALVNVSWPGRCQTVPLSSGSGSTFTTTIPTALRLDGAHTVQSMAAGIEWFRSVAVKDHNNPAAVSSDGCFRVLIFYCSHERNPVELLQLLWQQCHFGAVYFCTPDSSRPSAVAQATATQLLTEAGITVQSELQEQQQKPSWPSTLASLWKHLERQPQEKPITAAMDMASNVTVMEALERCTRMGAQQQASRIEVLVTGSLYLVGSALDAIQWEEESAPGGIVVQN